MGTCYSAAFLQRTKWDHRFASPLFPHQPSRLPKLKSRAPTRRQHCTYTSGRYGHIYVLRAQCFLANGRDLPNTADYEAPSCVLVTHHLDVVFFVFLPFLQYEGTNYADLANMNGDYAQASDFYQK
jgi:hypothetical protein